VKNKGDKEVGEGWGVFFFFLFLFCPPPILVIFLAKKNWEDLDFFFFL